MKQGLTYKATAVVLCCILAAITFLYLLRPITDPDFFWHLKTGEWIWQHKALPSEDPFSFTTAGIHTARSRLILTSYWASNILSHFAYLAGGMEAIVVLRFITAIALISALLLLRDGDFTVYMGMLILFLIFFFSMYPLDRPQVISFIFYAFLLYLLKRMSVVGHAALGAPASPALPAMPAVAPYLLPVLMLIWANTHRGFIIGQAVIILALISEGSKLLYSLPGPEVKTGYRRLLAAGLAGIAVSLVNPNTYYPVLDPLYFQSANNIEYLSIVEFCRRFDSPVFILYAVFMLLTIAGLASEIRRTDIMTVLLLAGTGLVSFIQVRYLPFFMITAIPFLSGFFMTGLRRLRHTVPVAALLAAVFFSGGETANIQTLRSGASINELSFPVGAADFVVSSGLRGNMYNHYNWGGYLIWRLAPERKVFIDGRELDPEVYEQSAAILGGLGEGTGDPEWERLLDAYRVRYVIIPLFEPSGGVPRLVPALLNSSDWVPVYLRLNSMVFVKRTPENYHVTGRYSIPKDFFLRDLIAMCDSMIRANPGNVSAHIAKGDLYLLRGELGKARQVYEEVLRIAPMNSPANERILRIETGRNNDRN